MNKPVLLVKRGSMSKRDVTRIRRAGIQVVELENVTADFRLVEMEPPSDKIAQANAAVVGRIFRSNATVFNRADLIEQYARSLHVGS